MPVHQTLTAKEVVAEMNIKANKSETIHVAVRIVRKNGQARQSLTNCSKEHHDGHTKNPLATLPDNPSMPIEMLSILSSLAADYLTYQRTIACPITT